MMRLPTPLPAELEGLVAQVIGCGIAVHRAFGPGLLESIYQRAVCLELAATGLPFESEKALPVRYRGEVLCHQRLDIVVDDRLILEIKSVERLTPLHLAQVVTYLRISEIHVGLLMNFNVPLLQHGLRRVVL